MRKYKINKKHPLYDKYKGSELELNNQILVKYTEHCWATEDSSIESWLKKGWIKEVKQKKWVIDKSDNWKIFKLKDNSIAKYDNDCVKFKSKKKALNYVLDEAKKRFADNEEIKLLSLNGIISDKHTVVLCSKRGLKA